MVNSHGCTSCSFQALKNTKGGGDEEGRMRGGGDGLDRLEALIKSNRST